MLQQDFGRKTEVLEENERTSESKIILSPYYSQSQGSYLDQISDQDTQNVRLCFASLKVGIDYSSCNQAGKDHCVGHEFSFKVFLLLDCIV